MDAGACGQHACRTKAADVAVSAFVVKRAASKEHRDTCARSVDFHAGVRVDAQLDERTAHVCVCTRDGGGAAVAEDDCGGRAAASRENTHACFR